MGGRCWCSRPNPSSVAHHSRYNGRVKQGVYCSWSGSSRRKSREGMNSKRGRGRKRAMKKANHLSPPQNLAVPRRQDSPAATYLCQSSDSEIALCCRFRQTASQGIAVSRISALRGQIYPVLGCLFLSSFDNVPACFPPHIFEPHLFFMQ